MTEPAYTLHYAPDNASLIVRLALEELGLPYRTRLVDRRRAAQRAPAHLALNPAGLIPALETPDGPIFETGAILLWLADRHGDLIPPPRDPARTDALKWLFYLSNTLHPALRMLFYPSLYVGPDAAHQAQLRAQTRANILRHVAILEADCDPRGTPSVLDLYLAPMLRWLQLYPRESDRSWFELASFAKLHHMALMLEGRASTHAAQTAEGLGPTPFTAPQAPQPPEGTAT
ncbi:glutathione S-transferase family protein [Roseobacter sinensis]|uniref:Glutathione S-transferase family protein n=1 Tax=Roseobacter sinensis TaxID=2931391 RepID=A0ABT3BA21_9RHOB|nr:glutathione S-transferase family protein [Roseobacter sp. WL0113]MCV3270395.1 glutathione S-transferase family protein [Roseobacter sp. WL0113]